jgi:hypothetical protein
MAGRRQPSPGVFRQKPPRYSQASAQRPRAISVQARRDEVSGRAARSRRFYWLELGERVGVSSAVAASNDAKESSRQVA